MFDPVKIRFEGSVGYLCGTLGDGADFEVMGEAGWSIGADMHAGSVVVHGGAGTNVGALDEGRHGRRQGLGRHARRHRQQGRHDRRSAATPAT